MSYHILAAILTPFNTDGSVWSARVPEYLDFLVARGVDGFVALGTNGEFASLDVREREQALEAVVASAHGRRVIANVSDTVTHEILRLTRHARDAGTDGVALLPPYYFPQSPRSFEDLAYRVADAFGGPIHLYNIPRYSGFAIPVQTVETLARNGVVAGLKDSSQDLAYQDAVRHAAPDIEYLVGSDTVLLDGLEHGASGAASGMANTLPELVVGAVRAFERGDDVAPWADLIRQVRGFFARHPYLSTTRHLLATRGMDVGPVRSPLSDLDAADRMSVAQFWSSIRAPLSGLGVDV